MSPTTLRRVAWFLVVAVWLAAGAAAVAAQQPAMDPNDPFVPIGELPLQDQLPAAPLLVGAYSFVLLALFAYLFSIARRLQQVQREVQRLETDVKRSGRA